MSVTEFLLARIAEDATRARFMATGAASGGWGSQRIFAECAAKRDIVDDYRLWLDCEGDNHCGALLHTLYRLAAIYHEHPDYREEWRP